MKNEELFEKAFEEFDFELAHETMEKMNWTWGFDKHMPSIDEIKNHIRELFDSAIPYIEQNKENHAASSSGRFSVTIYDGINVFIEFVPIYSDGL